ncbi:GNAT family N-acetyltransferase [Stenotrophomonas sp. ESTM1D_MKCIP4_1]|nr:GNAT family N-acetyltransferase [Stenotrophomonas sp. ESTM1D_MKCIP4_1]
MCIEPTPTSVPALHPVLRRHLLLLGHGSVKLRSLQRTDLAGWRTLCAQRGSRCEVSCSADAEVQLFIGIQRSRLQEDNDRLLLGVFDQDSHTLVDQLTVRLQSAYSRSAQLERFCQADWDDAQRFADALQALCPFLFEQVGLHRVYVMLPPYGSAALAAVLRTAGFENEGLLRDQHLGAAGWEDRCLHALTATRWRRQQAALG